MTRALLAAALFAGAAFTAPAQASDPRLVDRLYDPDQIVSIQGKAGVQATIMFGEDERIENVAIGDSQKWQVTPNKRANLLFVKPLAERAATNMTVVTDRHTYLFDLVASPANKNPLYVLSFSYPVELEQVQQADAAATPPAESANAIELAAANDPYAVVDPAELNFAWKTEGDSKLLPTRIYDDGDATFLTWPADAPLPAILVKDHAGTEGPVNFAVRGEVIVVDRVPREFILRSGGDVATLVNEGPVREPAKSPQSALAQTVSRKAEVK
ncbi:type IV secretion system protein VirB9 [Altererythrobacter atlanticus]|uniref:Type IV secretion system protein virB9 n=1 Tax=Croceibacterium atlanticum TaxID=1267766 RepID=A0A0F7KYQ1_9SPHN|nr:TrbG/VirB9 family P-type conjugative transfer protein [Croceibacterium atlanticum]AKH43935.1 Type IV secretion system protein virB9 precursor [Croceibacterium atlanticum]MBB5733615.1 type IV secretion system protein VirB9 [Croceibacterium atlanticum]